MTVRFLDIAEIELDEATRYYDAQALGAEFLVEVLSAVDRIMLYPVAWQSLGEGVRRCRLSRFPYALIYALEQGGVLVLAVAHLHREPAFWRDRLKA